MADFDFTKISEQPEPMPETVWAVCKYIEGGRSCEKCPTFWKDENGEEWRRGCYAAANETIKAVGAAQIHAASESKEASSG